LKSIFFPSKLVFSSSFKIPDQNSENQVEYDVIELSKSSFNLFLEILKEKNRNIIKRKNHIKKYNVCFFSKLIRKELIK
jgi:hypothetical protein